MNLSLSTASALLTSATIVQHAVLHTPAWVFTAVFLLAILSGTELYSLFFVAEQPYVF